MVAMVVGSGKPLVVSNSKYFVEAMLVDGVVWTEYFEVLFCISLVVGIVLLGVTITSLTFRIWR